MTDLTEYRQAAAEAAVLNAYDLKRSVAGHDYGNGQRKSELMRRRRELETAGRSLRDDYRQAVGPALRYAAELGDLEEFTADELKAARGLLDVRLDRVIREDYRRSTDSTRRTRETLESVIADVDDVIGAWLDSAASTTPGGQR